MTMHTPELYFGPAVPEVRAAPPALSQPREQEKRPVGVEHDPESVAVGEDPAEQQTG